MNNKIHKYKIHEICRIGDSDEWVSKITIESGLSNDEAQECLTYVMNSIIEICFTNLRDQRG